MFSRQEKWIRDLPHSRMVYPNTRSDKMKYWFWKVYTPLHPYVRSVSYRLGVGKILAKQVVPEMADTGRQNYFIGTIHPEHSIQDFVAFLVSKGFGNHFVAWKDAGEVVSMRRPVDFKNQYHIRIFSDGEIRGHYEFTPEYHTLLHLIRVGFEDRTAEFQELFNGWLEPVTPSLSS